MIAVIEAYKAGLFSITSLKSNILAGFIAGIVALPLAMAFAIASGVPPEQGIYTAIIAGLIVGIFGGSRVQISGPTSALVVIVSTIMAKHGFNGVQVVTMMAGGMLIIMSFLKVGYVIRFVPMSMILGFTAGMRVIIFVGQLKDFFGLPITLAADASLYKKIVVMIGSRNHIDSATTLVGLISLVTLFLAHRYLRAVPSPIMAILVATSIHVMFGLQGVATIGSMFGTVSSTLPHFGLPHADVYLILSLVGPAFTIAFLCAIESLISALSADAVLGTKHDSNSELFGQGLANMVTSLWGGFASTGTLARTMINMHYGATSPIAALVHSLTLMIILLFFMPYVAHIPLAALAAILLVVSWRMFNLHDIMYFIRKAPWYGAMMFVGIFFLTIFTDLVFAVLFGVIVAGLRYVLQRFRRIM